MTRHPFECSIGGKDSCQGDSGGPLFTGSGANAVQVRLRDTYYYLLILDNLKNLLIYLYTCSTVLFHGVRVAHALICQVNKFTFISN